MLVMFIILILLYKTINNLQFVLTYSIINLVIIMTWEIVLQYGIILLVLIIISLVIVKLNRKDFNREINKLVQFLGGKDNILDTEVSISRFKVTLKDVTKVDKDGIQKLGAKGIVEIDNQLKIIFGPESRALKKYIDEMR